MSTSRVIAAVAPRSSKLALVLTAVVLATGAGRAGAQSEGANSDRWVAPERAARQANPSTPTAGTISRGRSLYLRECEKCHGKAGHGDGPQAAFLLSKPFDLASAKVQAQSDGALFYKVTEGRDQMPRTKLNEPDRWAVITYLRTLAPRE